MAQEHDDRVLAELVLIRNLLIFVSGVMGFFLLIFALAFLFSS